MKNWTTVNRSKEVNFSTNWLPSHKTESVTISITQPQRRLWLNAEHHLLVFSYQFKEILQKKCYCEEAAE